ncbi:MAG: tRNA 5-methoxyuridine(34)/uridine 5-oxyacetic acid(34) synthase CmoB [Pseudomonadota bacterium]
MLDWAEEIHALAGTDAQPLIDRTQWALAPGRHGDWPRWQQAIEQLPTTRQAWRMDHGVLVAGDPVDEDEALTALLKTFIPWRKGPLCLGGVAIDTEWRSDWKWQRLVPALNLQGHRVLDIGAGNGYFGYHMLQAGAGCVIACDPTLLFLAQYLVIRHFSGPCNNLLLPLRFEDLPIRPAFDSVFSMGVLYHRKDPLEHLGSIGQQLRPGGQLILETLIIPGDRLDEFNPSGRYANMRNVYRLPTLPRVLDWLQQSGFTDGQLLDQTPTTTLEQRSTPWMPFHSLEQALDAQQTSTVEGHPPPLRACIRAVRAETNGQHPRRSNPAAASTSGTGSAQ